MPWIRCSVRTSAGCADRVGERLSAAGAEAVTVLPADETTPDVVEPLPARTPFWEAVRVEGLFAVDADLSSLAGLDCAVDFVADRDWSETWRDGFGPLRFGRLLILPRVADVAIGPGDVVLRLDPGLAFGTGTHASTALCLDHLARMPLAGKRVLDVGSGSGILAIAASLSGAQVVAVDHDPQARRATLDNARANGVGIDVESAVEAVEGEFDVVVANLIAGTIRDLASELYRCLAHRPPKPSGDTSELVLSGILASQVAWVTDAFGGCPQLRFEAPALREGWAMLRGQRCPIPTSR